MTDSSTSSDLETQQSQAKAYSIVVPVYNEEESLEALYREVSTIMSSLKKPYEIVFVNDCSNDQSLAILERFKKENPESVRIINLPERSGQTYAMRKGLDAMCGDYAITMDADLQNDPADIPRMLEKIQEGYDMVCGWRKARQDKPLKAVLSKTGNILQRLFTGMKIHDISCTLRVFKKECAPKIALNWEGQHRFIPLSLSLQGYRVEEIVSNHRNRKFGISKYSHKRIFRVMIDFFRVLVARGRK